MKKIFLFGLVLFALFMVGSAFATAYPGYYYRGSAFYKPFLYPSVYYGYGYNGWTYYNPGYVRYYSQYRLPYYNTAWIYMNNIYNYYPAYYGGYTSGFYSYYPYYYPRYYPRFYYPYHYRVYAGYPSIYVYN